MLQLSHSISLQVHNTRSFILPTFFVAKSWI